MADNFTIGNKPVIWSIAGLDNLSAAGSIMDVRSAESLATHCCVITTAITAQNSQTVFAIQASSIALLDAQWDALFEQTRPVAIKIGLVVNNQQLQWLIKRIKECKQWPNRPWLIYDPVTISSSGKTLTQQPLDNSLLKRLIGLVDLITPNISEAQQLVETEHAICDLFSQYKVAKLIAQRFSTNVLIKGGHLPLQQCTDVFYAEQNRDNYKQLANLSHQFALTSTKNTTKNSRGTGCALSTLIAAAVAQNYSVHDAIVLAKTVMNASLPNNNAIGSNSGCFYPSAALCTIEHLPELISVNTEFFIAKPSNNNAFTPCRFKPLGLYPVIDSVIWLEKLLLQGVKTVQLRIKESMPESDIEAFIQQAIALGNKYQAQVFINDYWQLAIKHGAFGVHLGQEDLQTADLNAIHDAGLRLGVSTHGLFELLIAHQIEPSYLAIGHIFSTTTKDMPSKPQGLDKLAQAVNLFAERYPLVAIGGINLDNAKLVAKTNVSSIAVVSAITEAENYKKVVQRLTALFPVTKVEKAC